ncbi:hypothetical protein TRIUR3_10303 [Triticum urartu]|uniref:Uncharacterized protein n=1 Tax=Triticum urartu TaxID=4572 RepID=M7ZEB1_TRIUA|nr:hypothetical protein TRIUR3_10303 [Triticum urartu]
MALLLPSPNRRLSHHGSASSRHRGLAMNRQDASATSRFRWPLLQCRAPAVNATWPNCRASKPQLRVAVSTSNCRKAAALPRS